MQDHSEFKQAIECAIELAEDNHLVTFGIKPHSPETGYGYIKAGEVLLADKAFRVQQFIEKPGLEKAKHYLSTGQYSWNSGMFMFKASELLTQLEQFEPEMLNNVRAAFMQQNNDLDFIRVGQADFEQCNNLSIDYALMEKTQNAAVVPLSCNWNDVGSWHALWESSQLDEHKNAIDGDVLIEDCEGCMVRSSHRLVTAIGLQDMVIVETADAVMIAPRSESQNVKQLTHTLKASQRSELDTHLRVYRPWGSYESVDSSEGFQVKRITVKSGEKLSLQRHRYRAEHWIVVNGTARVTCGDKQFLLAENESTYIPIGEIHRLENPGETPLELIEVQSGTYLGEDDIERFDDKYGR
jgi:mannose-1-phosphate guanylyltransferase/mannose-6-phosphate isomerase